MNKKKKEKRIAAMDSKGKKNSDYGFKSEQKNNSKATKGTQMTILLINFHTLFYFCNY